MRKALAVPTFTLFLFLSACQSNQLYDNDVIGSWVAEDMNEDDPRSQVISTQLELHSDYTFEGRHIDPRLILTGPKSRGPILDETTGTWSLTGEGLATGVYFSTKFPKHSRALVAMPFQQNGVTYLEIKSNVQTLILKKLNGDTVD